MEGNVVAGVAGVALSLIFGYVPGARQWFEALESTRKALVMGVLLILSSLIIYGGACYTPWQAVECAEPGFWKLIQLLGVALFANQTAYPLLVKPTRLPDEQSE